MTKTIWERGLRLDRYVLNPVEVVPGVAIQTRRVVRLLAHPLSRVIENVIRLTIEYYDNLFIVYRVNELPRSWMTASSNEFIHPKSLHTDAHITTRMLFAGTCTA